MTPLDLLHAAVRQINAGDLAGAEAGFREVLAHDPHNPDALHALGTIAMRVGNLPIAERLVSQAIRTHPHPDFFTTLGTVLCRSGQLDRAATAFHESLARRPQCHVSLSNLSFIYLAKGNVEAALSAVKAALAIAPDNAEALNNLGNVMERLGRTSESEEAFRSAVRRDPQLAAAHNNLGAALIRRGECLAGIAECEAATRLTPRDANAWTNIGNALRQIGRLAEAETAHRRAIEIDPRHPQAHANLAAALLDLGRADEALILLQTAVTLNPGYLDAWNNLGNALVDLVRYDEACGAFETSLRLNPRSAAATANYASALKDLGRLDAAIECYRRATELEPASDLIHSNLVYVLHFHPETTPAALAAEQTRWNTRHSVPLHGARKSHPNDRDPNRRLRIGFVSADLRDHAVAYFLVPAMEARDRSALEVFCYSGNARPDAITHRIRTASDGWRDVLGLTNAELAAQIRADAIDILVDLTMHTSGSRLPAFAHKPAPVAASWLAYPGRTGLDAIDYRITDATMSPIAEEPAETSEVPMRLPDCWCCYEPLGDFPAVSAAPCALTGRVTFGSLNNFCKIPESTLACWARIVASVPESRLLIHVPAESCSRRVGTIFARYGVHADRLVFVRHVPKSEFLSLFHQIDIALDSFPCTGMTTTCHSLYMGVPVITHTGATAVSRAGHSLLAALGLPELVARSEAEYIYLATTLALDPPRIAELRGSLRDRMRASPMMDAKQFAHHLDAAFRTMWQTWGAAGIG